MLSPSELSQLRANQRFLVEELQRRGIEVAILDFRNEVLEASFGSHTELLFDIDSSIMPYSSSIVSASKPLTKQLLNRAGIPVPDGASFFSEEVETILDFASALGFPVVVKPSNGFQGQSVHTELEDNAELRSALVCIEEDRGPCEVLVEEHFWGNEYRLFITSRGGFAAVRRDPAHVVGDGENSIEQLALAESARRLNPRKNCLGEIVIDLEAQRYLRKRGMNFSSVPRFGEKVYVRGSSNVAMGGVAEDVTDLVHPSFVEIGLRALNAIPNLPYAGLDIMTADISCAPTRESYRTVEVNSVPGIGIHINPGKGRSRNVAAMLADLIFPETLSLFNLERRAA